MNVRFSLMNLMITNLFFENKKVFKYFSLHSVRALVLIYTIVLLNLIILTIVFLTISNALKHG